MRRMNDLTGRARHSLNWGPRHGERLQLRVNGMRADVEVCQRQTTTGGCLHPIPSYREETATSMQGPGGPEAFIREPNVGR